MGEAKRKAQQLVPPGLDVEALVRQLVDAGFPIAFAQHMALVQAGCVTFAFRAITQQSAAEVQLLAMLACEMAYLSGNIRRTIEDCLTEEGKKLLDGRIDAAFEGSTLNQQRVEVPGEEDPFNVEPEPDEDQLNELKAEQRRRERARDDRGSERE